MKWPVTGAGKRREFGAELPQRVILQDERQAEGDEDRIERVAPDQRPQDDDLQGGAEHGDDDERREQRQPEIPGRHHDDDADIGAEHEQFAMREIDHVHDAEDQRQAGSDQRQDHAGDDAIDRLNQNEIEGDVVEKGAERVHRQTPRYCLMTACSTVSSAAAEW